jgi:O-antigen/teichoic acid export membrane protein
MIKAKDSVVSLIGVVSAQIVLFLCISLIGRLNGPEVLGHFNYTLALGTFAGTLLACRYELACVSDSPQQSFNALVNVISLSAGVILIAVAISFVAGRSDLYIVEAFAFAYFIQQAAGAYLNSIRRYGWIAACRLAVNLAFLTCLAERWGVLATRGPDVFVAYTVVNVVVAVLMLVWILLLGKRRGYEFRVSREFFVANSRFAKYILPSTVCGSVLTYALAIVIPHWFGAESAGYFAAAYRLGCFPVSLIGQSLGGVFRRDAVAAIAQDDLPDALSKVFLAYARSLVVLALLYAVGGALLFGPLVKMVFGNRWDGAIGFYYDLIPLFAFQMIYVPLSQVFLAVRQQRADFLFQLSCGATLMSVLFAARLMNLSAQASIRSFSLAGAMLMICGIALTFKVVSGGVSRVHAST